MYAQEERGIGGGLVAGLFCAPLIFGWLVLRRDYHPLLRVGVVLWMAISVIPLWMLASILWGSGDDVKSMARDFDRNRAVADRNAGTAGGFMKDYEAGDLGSATGASASAAAPSKAVVDRGPVAVDAKALARSVATSRSAIDRLAGHVVVVTGDATQPGKDGTVYLDGVDPYPYVILRYSGPAPTARGSVKATCQSAELGSAGPTFTGCRP